MAQSDAQNTAESCQICTTVNCPFKRPLHAGYKVNDHHGGQSPLPCNKPGPRLLPPADESVGKDANGMVFIRIAKQMTVLCKPFRFVASRLLFTKSIQIHANGSNFVQNL